MAKAPKTKPPAPQAQTPQLNIIHTADWHLRLSHLGVTARGPDFFNAAMSAVDLAVEASLETPTCMVICGDQLNNVTPPPAVVRQLRDIHDRLVEKNIPGFCILGNHDQTDPPWNELFREDDGLNSESGLIDITGRSVTWRGVKFHGLPPVHSAQLPELIEKLPYNLEDADGPEIALWHGSLADFTGYPVEGMLTVADLPLDRLDAFLLGDIHKRQYVTSGPRPCIVGYPGATELCNKMEPLTHSVTKFTVRDGRLGAGEELPVKFRPALAVRIAKEEDITKAIHRIKGAQDACPMVFVSYNPQLPGVGKRLRENLDLTKILLRDEPEEDIISQQGMSIAAVLQAQATSFNASVTTPEQLLLDKLGADSPLSRLGTSLCAVGITAQPLINEYVATRMAELSKPSGQ